jgi:hypothetical protein
MMSELRKFYYFTTSFLLLGLSWVGWNLFCFQQAKPGLQICVLKNTVGVACPSCGTTRSILHVLHGDITHAFLLNPFGLIAFTGMVVIPFWICYDYLTSKRSLWSAYLWTMAILQNKKFSFLVVILVVLNWIWNIQKGV